MSDPRSAITQAWAARAERERLLGRDREATVAEVAGWIELGLAARDPDAAAELAKLVAVSARTAGLEGLPASLIALRMEALRAAWAEASADTWSRAAPLVETLTRAAMDAHTLGALEARDAKHLRALRDMTPVFRAQDAVVAILIGPMVPELIDGAMARVLNECQAAETTRIVIDALGAERDDQRFSDTVAALLRDPAAYKHAVVLTGLADPTATRARLAAAGGDLGRLRFLPRLSDALSGG